VTIRELGPGETHLAHDALISLRPHLGSVAELVRRLDEAQRPEGFRLVASFVDGEAQAAACAGFRTGHNTAWGHYLYVDDLSTVPEHRREGHAGALMRWLFEEARRLGCDQLHLDSGHHRHDAHRVYLNHGLRISAHHFGAPVDGEDASV
jgi:GNAT superfamily N-acetyltransferase